MKYVLLVRGSYFQWFHVDFRGVTTEVMEQIIDNRCTAGQLGWENILEGQ